MRDTYSRWEDMERDSSALRSILSDRDTISISTPGIGFSDTLQASTTIRSIDEYYSPKSIVINSYHPELFYNNPRCISRHTSNIGSGNITLDSWPPSRLPNEGVGYNGIDIQIPVTGQWDIRVGLYGIPIDNRQEFYPTDDDEIYGIDIRDRYSPYIVIHPTVSPPRVWYNKYNGVPKSDTDRRARSNRQVDWEYSRWIDVINYIKELGYSVLQVGGGFEDILPGCVSMTDIGPRNTFMVIKYAKLLIGQPSFPMFAANAMRVPILSLWNGSYNSEMGQFSDISIVDPTSNISCAPCGGYVDDCPGYCMDRISTNDVINTILGILDENTN